MTIKRALIGDTLKVTWISSGVTPSDISMGVFTGSETVVDSVTMTDSGAGHYFAPHTIPDTPGYYVVQTLAIIDGNPYKRRMRYLATLGEVD